MTALHLKAMKPHCHGDQLACGETFKERQSKWEDEVEECQGGDLQEGGDLEEEGGHRPGREVVRSPHGYGSTVDKPGIGHCTMC